MKTNYHTHTFYCGHGIGTVEDYVKEAIKKGYDVIGMSEHSYVPHKEGLYLDKEKMDNFFDDVKKAKEKYKEQIVVKLGEEIDFFPDSIEFYKELKKKVDFLGLSSHYYDNFDGNFHQCSSFRADSIDKIRKYAKNLICGINTGIFDFVCHPDVFMFANVEWTKEIDDIMRSIIEAAIKMHCPLELNVNGLRVGRVMTSKGMRNSYCREEYLSLLKEYNADVIIGSDAHKPSELDDEFDLRVHELAKEYNLHVVNLEKK